MNRLIQSTDRRIWFVVLSLAVLLFLVSAAITIGLAIRLDRTIETTYAGMVGAVVELYPLAEEQVARELRSPSSNAVRLGTAVLERYGRGPQDKPGSGLASTLIAYLVPLGAVLVGLASTGFALVLFLYRRAIARQLGSLSVYLRKIEAGDYSLDLRDNDEGAFSLLKNDLYKITVRLREQGTRLQADKEALSDMVADISHQIKTPMTALVLLADLLAEDPPEADRRRFVEKLRIQLGRVQWLVGALLKMARLDAGAAAFRMESVGLRQLVETALEPLRIPLEIKNLRLELGGDPTARFTGDLVWSAEALTNVLKNCVEHTPEGGEIRIQYGSNPLFAEIIVSDTGEGIPDEDLPRIFQRFYRGANASADSVGIGLALAKTILGAQGGDISVRSTRGAGTTFAIRMFHPDR